MFAFLIFVFLYTLSMAWFYFAYTKEQPQTCRIHAVIITVIWPISLSTAFIRVFCRSYKAIRNRQASADDDDRQ